MASTEYLIFRNELADGKGWICEHREFANSAQGALELVHERLIDEGIPQEDLIGNWAVVPFNHFHWYGAREDRALVVEAVVMSPLDRQTALPVDDPPDKAAKK